MTVIVTKHTTPTKFLKLRYLNGKYNRNQFPSHLFRKEPTSVHGRHIVTSEIFTKIYDKVPDQSSALPVLALIHYPALPACKWCENNINSYFTTNLSRTVGSTGRNSSAKDNKRTQVPN